MRFAIRVMSNLTGVALIAIAAGCGGGPSIEATSVPSTIEVRVSAGAPVVGATVTVYAISDATGQVNNSVGAGGVVGSAGPTDATGKVTLTVSPYSGPVQIVAGGPAVTYADPTAAAGQNGVGPVIQVPSSFLFTSFIAKFKPGTPVPLTFLTTLADHAALAFAHGLHPSHPSKSTISEALAARDPLFVTHITNAPAAWDPASLRWTAPAPLTRGPQSLVDSAFAAIFDVALNQLARDTAVQAGYSGGTGGLTAPTLMQLLQDDLDADGRLDGLTFGGRTVATAGATPVPLDSQFLRRPLAIALAGWAQNVAVNKSGISDADLVSALVFKTITEDDSDLFGSAPTLPFDPLDRTPPQLALVSSPPAYSNAVNVRVIVSANDASGTKAVYAQVGATRLTANLVGANWQVDVFLQTVGHNTVTVWAEDLAEPAANSGLGRGTPYQLDLDVIFDPDRPAAIYDSAFASYSDERGLLVRTGTDGFALVPASYGSGARVTVANGGNIFKAATRLAAGGPIDAAELEATNAANIPVLRFSVPFNDKVDAPITKAEYSIVASCPGCGTIAPVRGKAPREPVAWGRGAPLPASALLRGRPGTRGTLWPGLPRGVDRARGRSRQRLDRRRLQLHVPRHRAAGGRERGSRVLDLQRPAEHLPVQGPGNDDGRELVRDALRPGCRGLLRRPGPARALPREQSIAASGGDPGGLQPIAHGFLESHRDLEPDLVGRPAGAVPEGQPGLGHGEGHRRVHVSPVDVLGHAVRLRRVPVERPD